MWRRTSQSDVACKPHRIRRSRVCYDFSLFYKYNGRLYSAARYILLGGSFVVPDKFRRQACLSAKCLSWLPEAKGNHLVYNVFLMYFSLEQELRLFRYGLPVQKC